MSLEDPSELPLPDVPGFHLHRRIGRGGSATVYLADQERAEFSRPVALKVVDRSVREEQRILARLEHPGIARLYDAGVTPSGQPWLAMEYVEGTSILDHCRAYELPWKAKIELFLPVLDAVAYAHARGIVHRDLKPANIFVTAGGEARLLDFGIARLFDPADANETRTLQRALTPAYASPEQMRGDPTRPSSDIYSLGVVLFELLTGALPRDTESVTGFCGDLDAILAKALRQRPEERYASAAAMADDLRRILAGLPASARREDRRYRARNVVRRHGLSLAIAIAALLFAGVWQAVSRWRSADARHIARELAIFHEAQSIDPETRRWLRDGADRLARFDAIGARDSFLRATASSKGNLRGEVLAWDGRARAETALGESGRAADAAHRAAALLAGRRDVLPRDEAERLRARALARGRNWNAAIPALERLSGAQPQRVDIGLELVGALLACGRTGAADTALGRLRQLAPPEAGNGDPRIDLQDAEVALQFCEYQRAAAAAYRARDRASRLQAVVLGQRAARVYAEAIARLDRRDDARRELESIVARNLTLGLSREAAAARLALGVVLLRIADPRAARDALEAALAGCAQSGDRRCEIAARLQLAILEAHEGKLAEAIRGADGTLADARAIGDRWIEGWILSQRLVLYNWADDAAAHDASVEPTLAALRDSGNRQVLMTSLCNIAITAIEALDLEKAEACIVEAEGLARRVGSEFAGAFVDRSRAYLEATRGDLDLARERYTSAVEKSRRAGVSQAIANYLADLAWLEVAANRPGPAAQHANEAIAAFTAAGDLRLAAATGAVLAWTDARSGNVASAQRRLAVLRETASEESTEMSRFSLLGIEAHIAEATGDWRRAIELRRQRVRMATEWKARGLVIGEQVYLAKALHAAADRRELEKLLAGMLPEVERHGLRGVARDLRELRAH